MAARGNGLNYGWKKIYGQTLDNKEMLEKYRKGWERIWGKNEKDQDTEKASRSGNG